MVEYFGEDIISKIVNIAVASAKIERIELPHINIRPNLHLVIFGKHGLGKSTILGDISEKMNISIGSGFTKAVLLGTADKNTAQLIPPMTWLNKGKPLLIDEFHVNLKNDKERDLFNTFLQVLEKPKYHKQLGFRVQDVNKKGLKVKNNTIYVDTNFSFICTTMMPLDITQANDMNAFVSRCLVIPYYPSLDDLKKQARGQKSFTYMHFEVEKAVKISRENYEKILQFVEKQPNLSASLYMRILGDLCRIYAVLGHHDFELYQIVYNIRRQMVKE